MKSQELRNGFIALWSGILLVGVMQPETSKQTVGTRRVQDGDTISHRRRRDRVR